LSYITNQTLNTTDAVEFARVDVTDPIVDNDQLATKLYVDTHGGGGSSSSFQDVYNNSATPTNINILAAKPINFIGPAPSSQTALKILSDLSGFTRVEGNAARFDFMATNSLEPLSGSKIDVVGDTAIITDKTSFTQDQEFITKKYVDDAIPLVSFQDVYNNSSNPAEVVLENNKPIIFKDTLDQVAFTISSDGISTQAGGVNGGFYTSNMNQIKRADNLDTQIQVIENIPLTTIRTTFTQDQEFITKKYVDDNIPASQTLQQVIYNSGNPIICEVNYGNEIYFKTNDSDNLLTIRANSVNDYGISSEYANLINLTSAISTSGTFIKNGGTNQQYLMADGSSLQYSANSGNSNFYLYNNTSGIMTPPPANGQVGYNNAIQNDATIIYISHRTRDTIDIDVFLALLSTIEEVYIQDQENSLNYIRYNITAAPTIIPNNYISIPVISSDAGGTGLTNFGNGHNILVSFFTNSIEVDTRLTSLEDATQYISILPPNGMAITSSLFAVKNLASYLAGVPLQIGANASSVDILATNLIANTILATTDDTYDLGYLGNQFRRGYFATALRCPSYDAIAVPLKIGDVLATAVDIGRIGLITSILGTTNINSVYTLPNTAPSVGQVLTCSALGASNWITPTLPSAFADYQLNFSQAGILTSQNGFFPATSLVAIGSTTTAITTTNASTRNKIFKCQNPTLSVADGQKSGYVSSVTANTWPIFFGRTGINLNIASGIGDTNTRINAITQMFQGLTITSVVPSFSSILGPINTSSIIGFGHDVGDSVISFYFNGTGGGIKIPTTFSTSTPSPYWFNFNISNACNSDLFTLTLIDTISGLTATQNFTMAIGNTVVMSPNDRLFFLSCRGMANPGGTTGSAISQFSKFQLSLR
jgi:hypothetical protein